MQIPEDWLDVPEPFATLPYEHHRARPNHQTAANTDCPWLFPCGMPGEHLQPNHITAILRAVGAPSRAARTATWRRLVRQAPPNVLADLLGVSATTVMRYAHAAGADWTR